MITSTTMLILISSLEARAPQWIFWVAVFLMLVA